MLGHTSELLQECQEKVRSNEAMLEQSQRKVTKLDTAFKTASQEVLKVSIRLLPGMSSSFDL